MYYILCISIMRYVLYSVYCVIYYVLYNYVLCEYNVLYYVYNVLGII